MPRRELSFDWLNTHVTEEGFRYIQGFIRSFSKDLRARIKGLILLDWEKLPKHNLVFLKINN